MKRLFCYMTLMVAMLLGACSSDESANSEQPLPDGMGCIRITICVPETAEASTRAVNEDTNDPNRPGHDFPWEAPDHEWERLQTFRVYICNSSMQVVQVISGDKSQFVVAPTDMDEHTYRTATLRSQALDEGTYYLFATANFNSGDNANDAYDDGIAVGSTIDKDALEKFTNSSNYYVVGSDPSGMKNIPMTGWQPMTENGNLVPTPIGVSNGPSDGGTLMLWRVMAKMQFEFTNESDKDIKILGVEVDPINKVSEGNPGIYVFSKDNLTSTADLAPGTGVTLPNGVRNDMGTVVFTPVDQPLTLAAKNDGDTDQGKIYFYINESDGTFTTTNNQYSLRFKVQRKKADGTWYDEEIRYGVTTHHDLSESGTYGGTNGGFNVIRRNDWIHIPVVLTDWQYRIEPLAFVPIAGYPATTVSSDGLTATFSTGGMVALQPFVKKYDDPTWRDFSDPEVTFVSVSWKNSDGDNVAGDTKIVKTAFAYDPVTHCIIGELNNGNGYTGKTTFTVNVTLGPQDDPSKQYGYSFTFNVIRQ